MNVFNETGQRIAGSVAVTGPSGDIVLDKQFDLQPPESNAETERQNGGNAAFSVTVWADGGDYKVTVTLTYPVEGVSEATETVIISKA